MDVQGSTEAGFEPVRQCFAEILTTQPGTGAAFAADALENALRDCLGVPPLPAAGQ